jgi:tetratricopeptide (TPR) repeat protein
VQLESRACLKGESAALVRKDAVAKFREARDRFRTAVRVQEDFSEAWNNLAVAAMHLEDWDGAIESAQNALRNVTYARPEVARANLGWAYYHKKKMVEAWKELNEAVTRSPGFCVGRYRLAKVYVERAEIDRAAEEVEAVVRNERCPIQEAYLLGGLLHERKKERDQARALFERCVSMAPRSCLAIECKHYAELIR